MLLRSFRTRLLLAIFGSSAAAVVAGGIFTYAMVKRHLNEEFDHFLGDKLRFHRISCMQHGTRISFKFPEAAWQRVHDPEDPEFFQFRFLDGRDLFRSYSIPDDSPGLPMIGVRTAEPVAQDCVLPNGNPGRALGVTFSPNEFDEGDRPVEINLVVAHQRGDLIEAMARLRRLIFAWGCVAALLLLGATMLIVRQLLRPLASLTHQIGEVPIGEEGGEFALADAPQELEPVVERLNALMARVSSALENERQFTNDAAHELRNPLAGLRSQVEVALERARDPQQDEDTLIRVLEVQRQMEGAVENLLALARLDSGTEEIGTSTVDVGATAKRAWKPYFDRASERRHRIRWNLDPDIPEIRTSPRLVEILLDNLFDNATTYTVEGGEITIAASHSCGLVEVEVINTNPGIAADEAQHLFQRFHRGGETSTGQRQHAGIGLSLCEKVVTTLGGKISASVNQGLFKISFSLADLKEGKPESG